MRDKFDPGSQEPDPPCLVPMIVIFSITIMAAIIAPPIHTAILWGMTLCGP